MRFEVFKRDAFTCQYCGRKAPDVVLQVDHIYPQSKGGASDILNLVTSCAECNNGKSDRELSDQQVLAQKRKQLESLQERKEQLEMIYEWQQSLASVDTLAVDRCCDHWTAITEGHSKLTDAGKALVGRLVRKFGFAETLDAMRTAAEQYLKWGADGRPSSESCANALNKVGGICYLRKVQGEDPVKATLYRIRNRMRKKYSYMVDWQAMKLLQQAADLGVDTDDLAMLVNEHSCWTDWRMALEALVGNGATA